MSLHRLREVAQETDEAYLAIPVHQVERILLALVLALLDVAACVEKLTNYDELGLDFDECWENLLDARDELREVAG